MQPVISKSIVWLLTGIGLSPAVLLLIGVIGFMQMQRQLERIPYRVHSTVYLHDQYARIQVGPISVAFFPRLWAGIALAIGLVLVVTATVFLLHVPISQSGTS